MKRLLASAAISACLLNSAHAFLAGPYAVDAYTLHLWHLDETATPCLDAVTSGGVNLVTLATGATLNNTSFLPGFGTALNTGAGGIGKGDTLSAGTPASTTPITITIADTTTGAFTFEAVVQYNADPTVTGTSAFEIMSGESGVNASRIFQWRIVPKGFTLITGQTATNGPYMTFENVRAVSGNQNTIYAALPTTGPDAVVSNGWYHVAVTYNGVPSTPNNLIMYWTAMNTNNTQDDALTIVSAVTQLTGLNPKATVSTPFMLGNQGRSLNGNFPGSIDEVRISRVARGASGMMFALPSVSLTPLGNQFVALGSTVNLTTLASGGLPIGYQWQFNNTNITGANSTNISGFNTNALIISNISFAQAGTYTLIATNGSSSNSVSCTVKVGTPIPGLFNTGVDASGNLLSGGSVDPHWTLISSADGTYVGPNAIVDSSIPGTYFPDGPASQWIAPGDNVNVAGGNYEYQTSFVLDSENTNNMQLIVNWGADNVCQDIILNGVDLTNGTGNGFPALTPSVITSNFVAGSNTLICVISNAPGAGPNLSAFRAELSGLAGPLPPTPIQILNAPSNVVTYQYQNASFMVQVYGSGPLSYQWYYGASLLSRQTNDFLLLTALDPSQAGTYTVVVSNSVSTNSASATLTINTPDVLEWTGQTTLDWDLSTTNWNDETLSTAVAFSQNVNVVFDNAGSAQPTVNLDVPLTPNSVVVGANNSYTLAGNGGYLTGNFNLVQNGPGTLVLDAPNTYSGNTIVNGGTLQIGNSDANGSIGSSALSNNASVVVTRTDVLTMSGQITGSGSLAMSGTGTLILTGNNPGFTGPTLVNGNGTLTPRTPTALGSGTAGTTVTDGAQLFIDQNINILNQPMLLGGVGNGNGALHKGGAGATTLGGPITLSDSAGIGLDGTSSLLLTNAAAITGTNINLAIQCGGGATCTVSGAINLGTGSLTEYGPASGTGTLILSSLSNIWTGGTTINALAVLQVGDGGSDGSIGAGTISDSGTLTYLTSMSFTETNPVTGSGVFNQSGTGRTLLSGNPLSGFSGAIHINGNGELRLTNGDTLANGTLQVGAAQADTGRLELTGNNVVSIPISIAPRAAAGTLTSTTPTTNFADVENISGTNILNSATPISILSGGNLLALQCDSGYLIFSNGVTAGGVGRDFAVEGAGSGEVDGPITSSAGDSVFVYVLGSGVWTFNAQNTYTGTTSISNNATLIVNGSITAAPVTAYAGTLGGIGTFGATVTIASGAKLAPTLASGAPIGTMTITSNLVLSAGSVTAMQISKTGATNDQITGMTGVTFGGTLSVTNLSGTLASGDSFQLFNAASYAGSFSSIIPASPGAGLQWNTAALSSSGVLSVTNAVITPPTIAHATYTGGNLILSGTGGPASAPYLVLTSTNLTTPLSNWARVTNGTFDGSGNFIITNVVTNNVPQSFYILDAQ